MIAGMVHLIDDDADTGGAITRLLTVYGYSVQMHRSAAEFMSRQLPAGPACLILDLKLPGIARLDLQGVLAIGRERLPIIFISGQDVVRGVRATKEDAVPRKTLAEHELLLAIDSALARSLATRAEGNALQGDREAFAKLTRRERQVCLLLARGLLNKQVGFELGTTEKTVKAQRAKVLKKLRARSLADLVRSVERLRGAGIIADADGVDTIMICDHHEPVSAFFRSPRRQTKYEHRSAA